MKLGLICKSCQEETFLKEKAISRPDLADKIGEDFSHRCNHCGSVKKYHVNQVKASKSSFVKMAGTILGVVVLLGVTIWFFMTGILTNIGLLIGAAIIAASNVATGSSNETAFNSYRL